MSDSYPENITTTITAYHERRLRELASGNSKMKWFSVSLLGLRGKCHPVEDLPHVVSSCPKLEEPRQSVTNGLEQLLVRSSTQDTVSISGEEFERLVADDELFTQFVVDPTSFNLPDPYRINVNDANLIQICKLTRNLCFSINQLRIRKLRDINNYWL